MVRAHCLTIARMMVIVSTFASGATFGAIHRAQPTLMRYPSASATSLAFVAHGNLWTVPLAGGMAKRLTHDPGDVIAPRFSPDGRWIAFTGHRAGARDVYAIPASGGTETRLTFDGPGSQVDGLVVAWTQDSRRIVFLSSRTSPVYGLVRAYTVPLQGGPAAALSLDRSGQLSFSPDGKRVAYNRIFRNFELTKRYTGGRQQDIYTYDFASKALTRITDWKGTDTAPMWFGHKLYFLSDRDANFRANIWSFDFDTRATRQITFFKNFDVDWLSLGAGGIAFQQGGKLWVADLPSERLREVKVDVPDDGERTAPRELAVAKSVRVKDALGGVDYALSPDGRALLVSARGDLFRIGAGTASNLTNTPGIDEDHPSWSPDGRSIAYATDRSGEQQIVVRPVAGGAARVLTHWSSGYRYTPIWSPNADLMAVADANHGLWLVALKGGGPRLIAQDPYAEIRDAAFSPDGRWLAYSTQRATRIRAIHLRELASGRDTVVSSPFESDRLPTFTPDGRLLAFVSQRNEQPFVSDRGDESLIATVNSDGVYAATLDRSAPPLGGKVPGGTAAAIHVDLDGLMSRAVPVPVTPGVIVSLEARGTRLFYETKPPQLIDGDLAGTKSALHAYDLAARKDVVVADDLDTHSLSADGMKVAYRRDDGWRLAGTAAGAGRDVALDVTGLRGDVDPRREWAEMFDAAWRLDRDVFFSRSMNGSNWPRVRDAYRRLLPLLGSQDDFLYLLGQLQGELGSSHTFIGRGQDFDTRPRQTTPLLGADYALDTASGRYRFARIYPGHNSRPALRGPLGAPGLDVRAGDYLLAVNRRELSAPSPPLSAFAGTSGRVTLTIARSADGPKRDVMVEPVDDDQPLRTLHWVEQNRDAVTKASGGRLGYMYLPDFSADGSREFVRQFYPQLDRQGLIIDIRWNWGGFTSQSVLDVLRREAAGTFVNREAAVSSLPVATAPRAMVTLINDATASDGDQFAYYFRRYGLGPLTGSRTWGGVQGVNGPWRLMDGSFITIPKDALASLDGRWVIENEGVTPDIPVEGTPDEAETGHDAQLTAAITAALTQIRERPRLARPVPAPLPAYPPGGNVPGPSFGRKP